MTSRSCSATAASPPMPSVTAGTKILGGPPPGDLIMLSAALLASCTGTRAIIIGADGSIGSDAGLLSWPAGWDGGPAAKTTSIISPLGLPTLPKCSDLATLGCHPPRKRMKSFPRAEKRVYIREHRHIARAHHLAVATRPLVPSAPPPPAPPSSPISPDSRST